MQLRRWKFSICVLKEAGAKTTQVTAVVIVLYCIMISKRRVDKNQHEDVGQKRPVV
jgi:hypothetical protein